MPMSHNRHNLRAFLNDTGTLFMIEQYRIFAEELMALLEGAESVEISVGDHPPLFVDIVDDEISATETRRFIILTQSAVMDGEYTLSPQIGFLFSQQDGLPLAEPVTYQNDRTDTRLAAYQQSPTGEWISNDPAIREQVYDLTAATLKDIRARGCFDARAFRVTR